MKKVVSKKIFHWLCLSCCSCLPIASSCTSNKPAAVSTNQNKPTNNSSGKNHGLFPQGMSEAQNDSPSTKPLVPNSEGSGLETNQPQGSGHDQGMNEQQDEAQANSPEQTTFPELTGLKKAVGVGASEYQSLLPEAALMQIKKRSDEVLKLFMQANDLDDKYTITIEYDDLTFADQVNGQISDLIANIKLGNKYEKARFNLTGLKKQVISPQVQTEHNQYLAKKADIDEQLKGLFPSFLATMLYYADNTRLTSHSDSDQLKLDYFEFLNGNDHLLNLDRVSLNQSLLPQFFSYKKAGHYTMKVVGIKFDDLKGTLGLKMRISNEDANSFDNPQFEETFEFDGFRKIDLDHPENNVLSFSLLPETLKTLLTNSKPVQKLLKENPNPPIGFNYFANLPTTDHGQWPAVELTKKLYQSVGGVITDDENSVYSSDYGHNLSLSSIRAINDRVGIYPFYTQYPNTGLFQNLSLTITQAPSSERLKNITLKFEVHLQVFVIDSFTTIDNLFTSANRDLVLPVSSSIALESVIQQA